MDESVATLIANAEKGDTTAANALFALLYAELHRLAKGELARNSFGATLGTTTLLHEAYLSMSEREGTVFPDRARFMGYAARAMRGVIIDHVRGRQALKRGGEFVFTPLDDTLADPAAGPPDLERVGAALDELAALEPRLAEVVELRFFCGFSFEEIAGMWKVSDRTVQRDWAKARIFLHGKLGTKTP
jgi:RNA polymerase sigma factor (TIGR02999 family)